MPFTPGSATDVMARLIGEKLNAAWGQPVLVENRPGAGGTIGIAQTAKADSDGYTLAVVSTGHVVNDVLYKDLPYDTLHDLAGVAPLANLPSVLVVPTTLGVRGVEELVALAVSAAACIAALPDVPTIAEASYPGGQFDFWLGLLAPAKTPRAIVRKVNVEVNRALQSPDMVDRPAKLGAQPMIVAPDAFDAFIREEHEVLGKVMRDAGAKPQ